VKIERRRVSWAVVKKQLTSGLDRFACYHQYGGVVVDYDVFEAYVRVTGAMVDQAAKRFRVAVVVGGVD
jgi:hypothetical protein